MHGWQDNAGTFDSLAPYLLEHHSVLAIDLPGHGLSSRIQDGLFYSTIDALLLIKQIKETYSWEKVSLLGHSMSSILGFVYCSLYPEDVDLMIGLDALKPHILKPKSLIPRLRRGLNDFILANERNSSKSEPPAYLYEELVERLQKGTYGSISKEGCDILLQRAISKSKHQPGKFFFHRDTRLKTFNFATFTQDQVLEMVENMASKPYLFIKASKSPIFEDKAYYLEAKEHMLKHNPQFEYHEVPGTHHVHLNEPLVVSGIISEFLNRIRPVDKDMAQSKL